MGVSDTIWLPFTILSFHHYSKGLLYTTTREDTPNHPSTSMTHSCPYVVHLTGLFRPGEKWNHLVWKKLFDLCKGWLNHKINYKINMLLTEIVLCSNPNVEGTNVNCCGPHKQEIPTAPYTCLLGLIGWLEPIQIKMQLQNVVIHYSYCQMYIFQVAVGLVFARSSQLKMITVILTNNINNNNNLICQFIWLNFVDSSVQETSAGFSERLDLTPAWG